MTGKAQYSPGTEMLGVVKSGPGPENVSLLTVPQPAALPGTVVVRVVAAGICGTDIHIANDEYSYEAPVVMGHEILGEVVAVADPGDESWLGKSVACETFYSTCEACQWCREGRRNLCANRRSLGSFEDGGFTQFVRVPVRNLHRLPENLGRLDGVLSEPLACAVQSLLNPVVICAGDRVLVTGPGAMGQISAQIAYAMGAKVTLAGLPKDSERLEVAESLGISTTTKPVPEESFDVVIECSGSAPGAASALRAAKRGAQYVQIGIFGSDVTLPMDNMLYKELAVSSGFASTPTSWRKAMQMLDQGIIKLGPLITREVKITDWEQAFDAAQAGEGIKTVLVP